MAFPPSSLPTNHADGDVITAAAENTANAAVNDVVTELVAYEASNNTAVSGKASSVHAHAESDVTGLTAALLLKAPLASPAFTGTPTAPTAAGGTNTTQVATTAFVKTAADAKVADAINDSTTTVAPSQNAVFDALALKANLASATFSGAVAVPDDAYDATTWNGSANVPTKNAVRDQVELLAPKASPTLTGTPVAPTAAQGTNTTQLATTAYVQTEAGLLVPKSLVDAAGDLVVATADNVLDRLAIGTDGQVLTVDTSLAKKVKWAAAAGGSSASPINTKSTYWQHPKFVVPPTGDTWPIINRAYFTYLFLPGNWTITAIAINVTGAGAAANVVRLGVLLNTSGEPGVVLGQGTVVGDATGFKTYTFGTPLTGSGAVWLQGAPQGAGAAGSTWQAAQPNDSHSGENGASWGGTFVTANGSAPARWIASSGAFTDNPAITYDLTITRCPFIAVRLG